MLLGVHARVSFSRSNAFFFYSFVRDARNKYNSKLALQRISKAIHNMDSCCVRFFVSGIHKS